MFCLTASPPLRLTRLQFTTPSLEKTGILDALSAIWMAGATQDPQVSCTVLRNIPFLSLHDLRLVARSPAMGSIENHLRVQLVDSDVAVNAHDAEEMFAGLLSLVLSDPHKLLDKRDDAGRYSWIFEWLDSSGVLGGHLLLLLTDDLYRCEQIGATAEHLRLQPGWFPAPDPLTDAQSARLYLQYLVLRTYGNPVSADEVLEAVFAILEKDPINFDAGILSLLAMITARCITTS